MGLKGARKRRGKYNSKDSIYSKENKKRRKEEREAEKVDFIISEYYTHRSIIKISLYLFFAFSLCGWILFVLTGWKMFKSPSVWIICAILFAILIVLLLKLIFLCSDNNCWKEYEYFLAVSKNAFVVCIPAEIYLQNLENFENIKDYKSGEKVEDEIEYLKSVFFKNINKARNLQAYSYPGNTLAFHITRSCKIYQSPKYIILRDRLDVIFIPYDRRAMEVLKCCVTMQHSEN